MFAPFRSKRDGAISVHGPKYATEKSAAEHSGRAGHKGNSVYIYGYEAK